MNTLTAFWHWVDNEKPSPELYGKKALDNLSPLAVEALMAAEQLVSVRTGYCWRPSLNLLDPLDTGGLSDDVVASFRPATRDLSLAIAAGLEKMHAQVEQDCLADHRPEEELYTVATPQDERDKPWYLRLNTDTFRDVDSGRHEGRLADAKPFGSIADRLLANTAPGVVLGRPTLMNDDGLAMFRHEYLNKWVTAQQREIDRSQRNTEIQLAAQATITGFDMPRALLGPEAIAKTVPLKPDPRPPHHRGKTSSVYDEETRQLDIYPATCVEALERIRGFSPRTIIVHGKPSEYEPDARAYLKEVVPPMFRAAGPRGELATPDASLDDFGL